MPTEEESRALELEWARNDLEVSLTGQMSGSTGSLQLDAINNGPNPVQAHSTVAVTGATFATPLPVQCTLVSPTTIDCAHVTDPNDSNEQAFTSNTDEPVIPISVMPTGPMVTATAVVRDVSVNATDPIPANNTRTITIHATEEGPA